MPAINFDSLVLGPAMAAFGEPVVFLPAGGPATPITAVFEQSQKQEKWIDGVMDVDEITTLGCQESQFLNSPYGAIPVRDDQFQIRGITWRAAEVLADGHGSVVVHVMLADNNQANLTPTILEG